MIGRSLLCRRTEIPTTFVSASVAPRLSSQLASHVIALIPLLDSIFCIWTIGSCFCDCWYEIIKLKVSLIKCKIGPRYRQVRCIVEIDSITLARNKQAILLWGDTLTRVVPDVRLRFRHRNSHVQETRNSIAIEIIFLLGKLAIVIYFLPSIGRVAALACHSFSHLWVVNKKKSKMWYMNRAPGASLDDATISSPVSALMSTLRRDRALSSRGAPFTTRHTCEWFIVWSC